MTGLDAYGDPHRTRARNRTAHGLPSRAPRTRLAALRAEWRRAPWPNLAAALLLALSLAALAALFLVQRVPMADLLVYRAEGAAVVHGTDLYGFTVTRWRLPATYPPFAALLFVPLTWFPPAVVKAGAVAGNAVLLALLVRLSLRLTAAGREVRLPLTLTATALALWLEPVFQTLVFGQINLVPACLVLWDLQRPDGARGRGLLTGVAAGVKLTPALFACYLLLTGRLRAGLTALVGFAGTVAVGMLVLPRASVDFWTRRIFETHRVGKVWIVDNQSLQGLAARLAHTPAPGPLWVLPAVGVCATGLLLARALYGRPAGRHPRADTSRQAEPHRPYGRRQRDGKRRPYGQRERNGRQRPYGPGEFAPGCGGPGGGGPVPGGPVGEGPGRGGPGRGGPGRGGPVSGLASGPGPGRAGGEGWGLVVTGLTALLVSPVSWSHHWVWCVPLLALLAAPGDRGPGRRRWTPGAVAVPVAFAVVFTARSLWLVPKQGDLDLRLAWWWQPLASPYPLLALGLFAVLALRCGPFGRTFRRALRSPARDDGRHSGSASGSASGAGAGLSDPDITSSESTIR